MSKERPIIMTAESVRAILAGTKTQTRRLVKNPPQAGTFVASMSELLRRPYGESGDRLWVKETWTHDADSIDQAREQHEDVMSLSQLYYRASLPADEAETFPRWSSPLFMPRWASRLTLEIVEVRVQRLHEIDGRGVLAEGVDNGKSNPAQGARWENMQRLAFEERWAINGKRATWASNPWVWAVTFRRVP